MSTSEFSLIARYFSSFGRGEHIDLSVGDDCALLDIPAGEQLATSIDTMISDVHFPADAFPEDIAYRAVAAAASDLAAMGAQPVGMLLALTLPEVDEFWLNAFSQGLGAAVSDFKLPLAGGDTTRGPLTITLQVMGSVPKGQALRRTGARVGDSVWVTGTLGNAAAALAFLQDRWQPEADDAEALLAHYYRPQPALEQGRQLLGCATSAIDISDGLLADAGHIAAASGVCIEIDHQRLPLSPALARYREAQPVDQWALTGGDDYQLCFTLPADTVAIPSGCTAIGRVREGEGVDCSLAVDTEVGYRHF